MLITIFKGLVFLVLTGVSSRVILELNVRLYPQLPWFVPANVFTLFVLFRCLADPCIHSRRPRIRLSIALLFGLCGLVTSAGLGIFQGWASGSQVSHLPPVSGATQLFSIAAMLFTPAYGGVVEEIVFRGFLQRGLEQRFGNFIGLMGASAMFVAAHAFNSAFETQWMFYLSLSVSLGLVAQLSGSIVLCAVLHCTFNIVSTIVTIIHGSFVLGDIEPRTIALVTVIVVVSTVVMARIVQQSQSRCMAD